jgi:hypothetical protein
MTKMACNDVVNLPISWNWRHDIKRQSNATDNNRPKRKRFDQETTTMILMSLELVYHPPPLTPVAIVQAKPLPTTLKEKRQREDKVTVALVDGKGGQFNGLHCEFSAQIEGLRIVYSVF